MRKKTLTKSIFNIRYSDSDKNHNNKTQRRSSEIRRTTNAAILYGFVKDDVFNESDWSEEVEAHVFNISILDIYKKAELIDDNESIFSECPNIFLMI